MGSAHVCVLNCFSRVGLFQDPMDCSHQVPLFMGFPRQEYLSRLPCPPPGNLPDSGIEPTSLASPSLAGGFFTTSATWEAQQRVMPTNINEPQLADEGPIFLDTDMNQSQKGRKLLPVQH